jgi:hypothetical protein
MPDRGRRRRGRGLAWTDLFPTGHRHARPLRGIGRAKPALELVLAALAEIHVPYCATRDPGIWVAEVCPVCLRSDRWPLFIVEDDCRRITLSCAGGCDQIDVLYRIVGAEEVAA